MVEIPKRPKEKKAMFLGVAVGVLAGALLPAEYNPVVIVADAIQNMKGGGK
jgi:hypothetical protein